MIKVDVSEFYDRYEIHISGAKPKNNYFVGAYEILLNTLKNTLEWNESDGEIELNDCSDSKKTLIKAYTRYDYREKLDGTIQVILNGFELLEELFPDYIKVGGGKDEQGT